MLFKAFVFAFLSWHVKDVLGFFVIFKEIRKDILFCISSVLVLSYFSDQIKIFRFHNL